jgi:hypothetical protein
VLAPHDTEDPKLGIRRRTPQRVGDAQVLVLRELVLLRERKIDRGVAWEPKGRGTDKRSHTAAVSGKLGGNPPSPSYVGSPHGMA